MAPSFLPSKRLDLDAYLLRIGYSERLEPTALVLEDLGFVVKRLAARVRLRADQTLPRTHMTLLVEAEGG